MRAGRGRSQGVRRSLVPVLSGPSCPSCNAKLLLWGPRRDRRTIDAEGRKWYQLAGYRQYCPECGVRLRSIRSGYFWMALLSLAIASGLGAHPSILEAWGHIGLALYYLGWTLTILVLAANVRYVRFPGKWS